MKPKIILIGVGKFGKNHLRVLRELEQEKQCTFYGVVDKRKEILERLGKEYGLETATELTTFLKKDVDAVDVVTPADTHFQLCHQCLSARKHVFVEKPLATNYAEAAELARFADEKKLVLAVGLIYRYNPAVRRIKELISSGELGKIYYAVGHYMGFKEPRTDVGALLNFTVHHIDIYDYLFEQVPKEITCSTAHFLGRKNFEDLAFLFLEYGNGAVGIIEGGWLPPGNYRDLMIVGSKKSVTSDIGKQSIVIHDIHMKKNDDAFEAVDKGQKSLHVKFQEPLKLELKDFIECIKTGRQPIANAHAASRTILIAEKALESARVNRSVKINEST